MLNPRSFILFLSVFEALPTKPWDWETDLNQLCTNLPALELVFTPYDSIVPVQTFPNNIYFNK